MPTRRTVLRPSLMQWAGLSVALRPEQPVASSAESPTDLVDRARFEVLPLPGVEDEVVKHLPDHATVTVTASPRRGIGATLEVAARLAARGVQVVPHLSARLVADEAELARILADLASAGVREVFVVGGDAETPVGDFSSALDVLQAMDRIGHDFVVGIAGYPEPHPKVSDDVVVQAMWDKRVHASYIVSQMCFDAGVLRTWVQRVRDRGVLLPIHVGVPGPATTGGLLRIAQRIGVGQSVRVLNHHGPGLLRLARPGTWRPDDLLADLAPLFSDPAYGLAGLHFYTFNALPTLEQWRQQVLVRTR